MKAFINHTGILALLKRKNVDTDQIIPKQFLTKIEKTGFGKHLFQDWRYNADGNINPEFELNQPEYKGATILLAGDNFGCGSSREHAPWALLDYGFRAIISTSFADIFYNNCFKNGILLIKTTPEDFDRLVKEVEGNQRVEFTIDLENTLLRTPAGIELKFEIDAFKRESLLNGLDPISWSLKHLAEIECFEEKQRKTQPWLWN